MSITPHEPHPPEPSRVAMGTAWKYSGVTGRRKAKRCHGDVSVPRLLRDLERGIEHFWKCRGVKASNH